MKSNPPRKIAKSALTVTLFEQPPQAQIRPKSKYFCAHQIANDRTIILSTENVQKVHSRPKLWEFERGCGKISQNTLTVTLFKQWPQAQIWPKFKNLCVHQKANDQMIVWKKVPPKWGTKSGVWDGFFRGITSPLSCLETRVFESNLQLPDLHFG